MQYRSQNLLQSADARQFARSAFGTFRKWTEGLLSRGAADVRRGEGIVSV